MTPFQTALTTQLIIEMEVPTLWRLAELLDALAAPGVDLHSTLNELRAFVKTTARREDAVGG